ncbi:MULTISPECIES: aspartate carbamoyltransferase regulatory subunit [Congzhengia]|uniref:Aspartate carbamoyltransferase regulatory subunit n=1 Tax=Congzhengia minquanensis TaxID=2763657 RepID=A0A926DNQ8_9FIRM|nr:aspartate carbamoyltransferase regulatory subunit [Congzhengia minquanensis]MBC8541226.1 aspartate carbamoyltransferase regulatory subunit [Congzhengia minquanensis]HBL81765.1 aspartate carbamoyltransferase regulatory subunit [Clostridiales bacterium]
MIIGQIKNGIVLDHITAGMGMELYNKLGLGSLACQVALIKNAESKKMGRKDIIKIDEAIDIDLDALGYIDESITVNIIKDGKLFKRKHLEVPERVVNILKCKNPRCITTTEQELPHIFKLTNREKKVYRCIYCESKGN